MKLSKPEIIKIAAVVTAAPRWVIALLAAEGFLLPEAWLGWWVIASAVLSLGMAIVEGLAFSYIFNAWRVQKDKAANHLLWLAGLSALVFVAVMSPSIASGVRRVSLGTLLSNDWALYAWSVAVSLSTIVIVAGVGYAEKQTSQNEKTSKSEPKTEIISGTIPLYVAPHNGTNGTSKTNGHAAFVCPYCERSFKTKNALNPHVGKCKAKADGVIHVNVGSVVVKE